MFKKMKIGFAAATFRMLRLSLVVTIWSCHAWLAPTFRLCHGLAAVIFGLQDIFIDRRRIAAIISKDKTSSCSSHGVLGRLILRSSSTKIKHSELRTTYSELSDSRPRVALIKSIPRIWGHGVKQPTGEGAVPNSLPIGKAGELRTPNFRGFTLIEVIAFMIVIGILAAIVLPRIDFGTTSSRASVDGAAYMIASDIRYTQECAMATRTSKTVTFYAGANSYSFALTPNNLDPTGQLPSGVTTTALTLTFNSLGEPTSIPAISPYYVDLTVSGGGLSRTTRIWCFTGKVAIL